MGWFAFLNPAFLWGALAASIPIIIHLINRRRARVVRFPAVQFILRSERRVARKYRVKQWLLLALRTLILFLLTTALAEPVLQPNAGDLAEINQARALVVVIDNSLSMTYQAGGTTAWDLAKEAAGLLMQELRPQDQAAVLPLVSAAEPPGTLSADRWRLSEDLGRLSTTFESGSFVAPLQQAYTLLKTSEAAKKEIFIITDRTRTPWIGLEPASLQVIDPQVQVTVVAVGGAGARANATVSAVRLEHPPVVAGVRTRITANLINYGAADRPQVPVRLVVDDRMLDQRLVDLPGGRTMEVSFEVALDQPGMRAGAIRMAEDAIPGDDVFYFTLPVRKALRVLVIDGDPRTTLVASETFYLLNALAPARGNRAGAIQPRVVPVEEAEELRLGEFDVILLANVKSLSASFRTRLLEFAKQGGGLWWFLGHHTDPDVYNRTLFDTSTRLLPARLGPRLERGEAHPVALRLPEPRHPALQSFSGEGSAALAGVRVRRLLTTEMAALPPETRTLVSLPDARPLLLEGKVGQGRVWMFTSTADVDWNELPVTTAYLPLVQTGVIYLASSERSEPLAADVRMPQSLQVRVPEGRQGVPITIVDPGGKEARLFPQELDGRLKAQYDEAKVPGFYRLKAGSESGLAAVNAPLEESDLTDIQLDELRDKLPGIPFALVQWERGQSVRPPQVQPLSLAGWFLIGLLALLLVEGVFANRLR
jgi:hypothetical protein